MKNITNLSQLKKALTVGTKLKIKYATPVPKLDGTTRAIKKVQSNAIQFENDSWLFWEKAKQIRVF